MAVASFGRHHLMGQLLVWIGASSVPEDEIDQIVTVDPLTGERLGVHSELVVFPASHYVTSQERMKRAIEGIEVEDLPAALGPRGINIWPLACALGAAIVVVGLALLGWRRRGRQ